MRETDISVHKDEKGEAYPTMKIRGEARITRTWRQWSSLVNGSGGSILG